MSRRPTIINKGGITLEGKPDELGCALNREVITPVAAQIVNECSGTAIVEFYTGLTTHLMCSIALILGPQTAKQIAAAATNQVDAAVKRAAAQNPGVH
jgi:hypothetical protein